MGLLPQMARSLGVSIPAAGSLVTAYALGVALGAPLLTLAFNRIERKAALLWLLTFFVAGNALAAVAPNYGVLLAARILASLCHGTFFGIGALVAAALVTRERSAQAISMMFTGLTVATVIGVPFGSLIGVRYGWRTPFGCIAVLGVIALLGVWRLIPTLAPHVQNLRAEIRALLSARVGVALLTTTFGFAGVFTLFTYIAPLLLTVTHFSANAVSGALVLFGVGTVSGNIVSGRFADRALRVTLLSALIGLAAVLALSTFAWGTAAGALTATFLIGFFGLATGTPLQVLMIRIAGSGSALASSANQSAFNIGNAAGAALGGAVISAGLALPTIGIAAAAVTLVGIALAFVSLRAAESAAN